MSFLVYDLTLLGIFIIFLGIFLYKKRKNVKREGLLLLYRTSWGIKLIDRIGNKYRKALEVLSYVSVVVGYFLMAGAIWLVGRIVWIYAFQPAVVKAVKVPPITPLVPYIDKLVPSLGLPSFYFTYWIIIIAVIAIFHEFAHGIFAAKSKVKIRSTGFGFFPFFLPIFLAAFVEPDEKQMPKKKIFDQLAVLSAGTFANLITAIVFFLVIIGFFAVAFAPSGVAFDTYPTAQINTSAITNVGFVLLANPSYDTVLKYINNTGFNEIKTSDGEKYLITKSDFEKQNETPQSIIAYYDAPAVKANLESIITAINGEKVTSIEELSTDLHKYAPGTTINVTVLGNQSKEYNKTIVLGQNPSNSSESWLGVGFYNDGNNEGILKNVYSSLSSSFKRDHVYYMSRIGDFGIFIYNLLWWLVLISVSVAIINMLPMGIFDGGRFFYLTVLAITKKEKVAQIAYKTVTYLFLAALAVVMFFWIWYVG